MGSLSSLVLSWPFAYRSEANKKVTFAVHANKLMKPLLDTAWRPIDSTLDDDPSESYLDEADIPEDCFGGEQTSHLWNFRGTYNLAIKTSGRFLKFVVSDGAWASCHGI